MKDPLPVAIFVGLGESIETENLGHQGQLKSIYVAELGNVIDEIDFLCPKVIVADATLNAHNPDGFLNSILDHVSDFRDLVVLVSFDLPFYHLTIHEWCNREERYGIRSVHTRHLGQEIERLCGLSDNHTWIRKQLSNIGYADNIVRGNKSYHIQTEIITTSATKIKTTILDKGSVVDALVKVQDEQGVDFVQQTEEVAQLQHKTAVERVNRGLYD